MPDAWTHRLQASSLFELASCWGSGDSAAADGTLVPTYDDNLFAAQHVRYGRTGGIAYRHIADNYVALFSHFIPCGVHEAVYILDGLLKNSSDVRPSRLHADTHGQSTLVFALAYLLGIDLMPRIRNWRALTLFSHDKNIGCCHTAHLYNEVIDWDLIADHWDDYLRVVLAVRTGRITASWILTRLNNDSRHHQLYQAFQELGKADAVHKLSPQRFKPWAKHGEWHIRWPQCTERAISGEAIVRRMFEFLNLSPVQFQAPLQRIRLETCGCPGGGTANAARWASGFFIRQVHEATALSFG